MKTAATQLLLIYPLWQLTPCSHIGCPVNEYMCHTHDAAAEAEAEPDAEAAAAAEAATEAAAEAGAAAEAVATTSDIALCMVQPDKDDGGDD